MDLACKGMMHVLGVVGKCKADKDGFKDSKKRMAGDRKSGRHTSCVLTGRSC